MRLLHLFGVVAAVWSTSINAKPILSDSQQTYFSACMAADRAAQEQAEVCQAALSDTGLSASQRIDAQLELADAWYSLDRFDESQEVYQRVRESVPNNVEALNGLAWVHWSRDEYEPAIELFEMSVARRPTSQGLAGLASSKRHSDAITSDGFVELMQAALALNPKYTWAQRELGWGLLNFGQPAAAEAAFRDAVEIAPSNQWNLYALGYALNDLDRHEEALEVLLRVDPDEDTPTGYFSQLSLARYYTRDYKAALKAADLTIEGWPDRGTGYVRKARALEALGRRAEGVVLLQEREALRHDGFVAYWLSDLLYEEGNVRAAMDVMDRSVEQGTADSYNHELRAFFAIELQQFDAAWSSVDAALSEAPNSSYAFYYKALLLVEGDDLDAADVAMDSALENGLSEDRLPDYISAIIAKGKYLRAIKWRLQFNNRSQE